MLVQQNAATNKASLVPDTHKGVVRLVFDTTDELLKFEWHASSPHAAAPPDEFILFDDDASFDKLKQAPPGSRVYALRFASTGKRAMYYLLRQQDAAADDLLCQRVKRILADPRAALDSLRSRNKAFELSADDLMDEDDHDDDYDNDDDANGDADDAVDATPTRPGGSHQRPAPPAAAQMQSILANMFGGGAAAVRTREPLELTSVLTSEIVAPHLADPGVAALLGELHQLMPEGSGTAASDIVDLLRSPQFKQALAQLDGALQSGELAAILMQVGVPIPSDADLASDESALVFLRAFIAKHRR
jgi:26S proteasome regulatory subunit N13